MKPSDVPRPQGTSSSEEAKEIGALPKGRRWVTFDQDLTCHADDIVRLCCEIFGEGNDFSKKLTYKTTGEVPKALIAAFRNSYHPRNAVTVDMVATGTDIKPLEIVSYNRSHLANEDGV